MFSVFRVEKFKKGDVFSVLREAQRTPELHQEKGVNFDNDIDWTRTANNVSIVSSRVSDISRKMKNEGVRPRNKDSVVLVGAIISASPEYFNKDKDGAWLYDSKVQKFGEDVKRLVVEQLCGGDASRLVSLQLHLDEGSPHWHALVLPIVEQQGEKKLSAKALLNGRQRMRELQDRAFEILGEPRGFDRGEKVDLTKPSKSQKRHKSTGQFRDEQAQAALDRIIDAAEHLDKDNVDLLNDLKDAAFGRGKILPIEKYDKAVEILRTLEALPEALAALKDLRDQADKNGRIKTLEGRIDKAHEVVDRAKNEVLFRRQYDSLVDKIFSSMYAGQSKTALDVLKDCVKRATTNGDLDIELAFRSFKNEVKTTKEAERSIYRGYDSHDFPSLDDQDGPILE